MEAHLMWGQANIVPQEQKQEILIILTSANGAA